MKRWAKKLRFYVSAIVLIALAIYIYTDLNLKPVILSLAESQAKALGTQAINGAIFDLLSENSPIEYNDLITIMYDKDGRVTMLQTDTMRMNELSVKAALLAQQKIAALSIMGIKIPVGSVTGSRLLAGWGPAITVHLVPTGSAVSEFVSDFTSAGINQTRHRIYIKVTATVRMVVPTGSQSVGVSAYVLVAESIIVGSVPGTYANISPENVLDLRPATN